MRTTLIYILRHGQAGGHPDPPLSESGRRSALLAAGLVAADCGRLDLILASPMRRTEEHARILAAVAGGVVETCNSMEPEGDSYDTIQTIANLNGIEKVALVGHLPQLRKVISALVSESGPVSMHIDTGGVACIEADASEGALRGILVWMVGETIMRNLDLENPW